MFSLPLGKFLSVMLPVVGKDIQLLAADRILSLSWSCNPRCSTDTILIIFDVAVFFVDLGMFCCFSVDF